MRPAHTSSCGLAAWLLASVIAVGCSEPTEPPPRATLSVAVVGDPIPGATSFVGSGWTSFSVDVLVKNESDVAVQMPGCGPAVERESQAGSWPIVAEMLCALGAGDAIELPPRSERQWRQTIAASRSDALAPGRYRLMFRYAATGQVGPLDEARSAPFELK
jgi:hypothetical protein